MACKQINDDALCILRKKRGRGFAYLDDKGQKIQSEKILERIKALVIPPNWREVKICDLDNGHIQAVGRDEKGRKQYIYHPDWSAKRQKEKYSRLYDFGKSLPKLRKKAYEDLEGKNWTKEKVLGLMIVVLDETGIRIGSRQYEKTNNTYGLTTLRRKHLDIKGESLRFIFKGKSNIERTVSIEDKELISYIKESAELPGYELFRFEDDEGKYSNIDSSDVNEYISEAIGEGFSSKDFRTWVGSRLCIELFPEAVREFESSGKKKLENLLLELVSCELGNTPSICRDYYIHPLLMRKIEAEEFPTSNRFKDSKEKYDLSASEKLLLKLLGT